MKNIKGYRDVLMESLEQEGLNLSLLFAAEEGNAAKCRELLEMGADPNAVDGYGEGPLHKAVRKLKRHGERERKKKRPMPGDTGAIEALLAAGANPNMKSSAGDAPMHTAAKDLVYGSDVLKVLSENGADLNIQGARGVEHGTRPIDVAVGYFNTPFIVEFIRRGGNVFNAFKDLEAMSAYFGGNLDWIPEDVMKKLQRMERGRSAFGM